MINCKLVGRRNDISLFHPRAFLGLIFSLQLFSIMYIRHINLYIHKPVWESDVWSKMVCWIKLSHNGSTRETIQFPRHPAQTLTPFNAFLFGWLNHILYSAPFLPAPNRPRSLPAVIHPILLTRFFYSCIYTDLF